MSEFFSIGEVESRTLRAARGTVERISVRMVTATEDHVGDPFVLRDETLFRACRRCGGYGHYSYNPLDGTYCFDCYGHGLGEVTTWEDAEKLVKARRASRNRAIRAERNAAHEVALAWDAFRGEHTDVIAWLDGKEERSGFVGDMSRKVANLIALSPKMVEAVRRIIGQEQERSATRAAAGHFGTVGKREKAITAKVIRTVELPDYGFGISWLIVMETPEGHALVTKTSGAFAEVEAGETYTFAGTVKEHGEYKGEPQTSLTRCALPKAK